MSKSTSIVEQAKAEVAKANKKPSNWKQIESVTAVIICGIILLGLATVGAKQFINFANKDYQLYAAIFFVVALAYITLKAVLGFQKSK